MLEVVDNIRFARINPDIDFDGSQQNGDDGTGNGLTFDVGFEADMWIGMTCGGDTFATYANYAELPTEGAGYGEYVGSGSSGAEGNCWTNWN